MEPIRVGPTRVDAIEWTPLWCAPDDDGRHRGAHRDVRHCTRCAPHDDAQPFRTHPVSRTVLVRALTSLDQVRPGAQPGLRRLLTTLHPLSDTELEQLMRDQKTIRRL